MLRCNGSRRRVMSTAMVLSCSRSSREDILWTLRFLEELTWFNGSVTTCTANATQEIFLTQGSEAVWTIRYKKCCRHLPSRSYVLALAPMTGLP